MQDHNSNDSFVVKYAEWLLNTPWKVLLSVVLVVILMASGARLLTLTSDYRAFFSEDNPQLTSFDQLEKRFTKVDNVLIALTPNDDQVFTSQTLAAVSEVTERAWQLPYAIRVDSISNFQHTYAEADDLIVKDLIEDPGSLSNADLVTAKNIALNEPQLINRLISPKTDITAVNVTVQLPGLDSLKEVPEIANAAEALAADIETRYPHLQVDLTGIVMINNSFVQASNTDLASLIPVMFLFVIITLGLLLRSASGTFVTVTIIMLSIAAAMGLTGYLTDIKITPPSAAAPTIILTLVVANSVHMLVNFLQMMRSGVSKASAIIESLRINLQPIFLTNLTTAIGFLSLNFSDSPPYRDLGNIVAMGVGAAFALSITLLPVMMMLLPVRVNQSDTPSGKAMERFSEYVISRRNPLLIGTTAIMLLIISFLPMNQLNDDFVKFFDNRYSFRTSTDHIIDRLTGFQAMEYSLDAGEEGGVSNPEFLSTLESFANWFREQKDIVHVNSYSDVIKRLNKNLHADDPDYYRIPQERELAAQYLLLYEMSLPYGLDLNNQISVDKSATRMTVTLGDVTAQQVRELEDRAALWLENNAPQSMRSIPSGPSMMFTHISKRNVVSMGIGSGLALLLISALLIVAFRSIKIGLISLIPNVLPILLGFGVWGMLYAQIGMSLAAVIGMTLGIVVDDTVHFLSKYLRARREKGYSPEDAVRYAFNHVGMALWITSLVLIVGFLVLSTSGFQLNAWMGLLTAIVIALALAADFLFLPPLLMKLEENTDEEKPIPVAIESARA